MKLVELVNYGGKWCESVYSTTIQYEQPMESKAKHKIFNNFNKISYNSY